MTQNEIDSLFDRSLKLQHICCVANGNREPITDSLLADFQDILPNYISAGILTKDNDHYNYDYMKMVNFLKFLKNDYEPTE